MHAPARLCPATHTVELAAGVRSPSAPNYCLRYRPAARIAETIDSATCHLGFRWIVRPAPPS